MELFRNLFRYFKSLRFASILNISGLAVALAVFLMIVVQLHFEWGYDRFHPKSDRIFRVEALFPTSLQYSASTPLPLGEILKMQLTGVEDYFILNNWGKMVARVKDGEEWSEKFPVDCMLTSASMVEMLDMRILEGDAKEALSVTGSFVIPESLARKWFQGQAVGKQIRIGGGEEYVFTIGAVYQDFPSNSVFANVCYTNRPVSDFWGQWDGQLFVLSETSDIDRLQRGIDALEVEPLKMIYESLQKEEQRRREGKSYLKVVPLTDIYYDDQVIYDTLPKGNQKQAFLMLGVGILVIFIALVNFVNFTLSLAPARMRSVNTRKVLGASTEQLRRHFIVEALVYVGVAYVLAMMLIQIAIGCGGEQWSTTSLGLADNWKLYIFAGIGVLIVGGLAGYYPACYVTSFVPALALKGNFVHTPRGVAFRKGLSVFQFTVSVVLIACAILMIRQNRYIGKYALGYETENIGWVKLDQGFARNTNAIINEVRQLPGVVDITFSDFVPGGEMIGGRGIIVEGIPMQFDIWNVHYNFLQFFGVPLLEGDTISVYNQNQSQILLNEGALKKFPVLQRYLGKSCDDIFTWGGNPLFIGVTGDIHYLSLHQPIGVLAMIYKPDTPMNTLFFKLAPGDQPAVVRQIEGIFDRLAPESLFEFHFLDDTLQQSYEYDHRVTSLVSFLGGLAIFLALVGIYGMVVFQTEYRRKEIAVRKVNGATVSEILFLLNKGMLYQGLAGFIIACPLAYYIMEMWLRNFSYHTDIRIWIFVSAGMIVLSVLLLTVAYQSMKAANANPVRELIKE